MRFSPPKFHPPISTHSINLISQKFKFTSELHLHTYFSSLRWYLIYMKLILFCDIKLSSSHIYLFVKMDSLFYFFSFLHLSCSSFCHSTWAQLTICVHMKLIQCAYLLRNANELLGKIMCNKILFYSSFVT
jgi:hypothetical protein